LWVKPEKMIQLELATHLKEYDEEMDDRFIIGKSENAEKLLRLIDEIEESIGTDFQMIEKGFWLPSKRKACVWTG
jgi:hypothetical protein